MLPRGVMVALSFSCFFFSRRDMCNEKRLYSVNVYICLCVCMKKVIAYQLSCTLNYSIYSIKIPSASTTIYFSPSKPTITNENKDYSTQCCAPDTIFA
jgi:hypothetical protein